MVVARRAVTVGICKVSQHVMASGNESSFLQRRRKLKARGIRVMQLEILVAEEVGILRRQEPHLAREQRCPGVHGERVEFMNELALCRPSRTPLQPKRAHVTPSDR